jgi:hypothetical protein
VAEVNKGGAANRVLRRDMPQRSAFASCNQCRELHLCLQDASQVAPLNPDNFSLQKEESTEGESNGRKRSAEGVQNSGFVCKKTKRKISQVERLKREADAKRAAQEAERQERLREIERRQKEKEAAERARKQTFAKMHKKTSRGQPVMKHRMEHLLEKLQTEAG